MGDRERKRRKAKTARAWGSVRHYNIIIHAHTNSNSGEKKITIKKKHGNRDNNVAVSEFLQIDPAPFFTVQRCTVRFVELYPDRSPGGMCAFQRGVLPLQYIGACLVPTD